MIKLIEGYDGQYIISSDGIVYSMKSGKMKELKPDEYKGGYLRVSLSKNNKVDRFPVHRLVAIHFIKNPFFKTFVNHKDGNKKNNKSTNLEWCTRSENEKHSYSHLGKIPPCAKRVIDKNGIVYTSITKAAKANGIKPSTLLAILNGQNKTNNTGCRLL